MKLETCNGKIFDIRVIVPALRNNNAVLIELEDVRSIAEIAADFDGLKSFEKYDDAVKGVREKYEGFSRLVSIQRNDKAGTVRLTLERV